MTQIPLSGSDQVARIDDDDFERVSEYSWTVERKGETSYAVCYLDPTDWTKVIRLHRLIMDPQSDEVVDHIDGDGLNNQRANLRVCTQRQNVHNRRKVEGGTSRFKGVSFAEGRKKSWRAQIRDGEKSECFGYFATQEDAARAYDAAARARYGDYAWLNFTN